MTLSVIVADNFGLEYQPNKNALALQVEDVATVPATLEERGVEFARMLHHRCAPRTPEA